MVVTSSRELIWGTEVGWRADKKVSGLKEDRSFEDGSYRVRGEGIVGSGWGGEGSLYRTQVVLTEVGQGHEGAPAWRQIAVEGRSKGAPCKG